MAPRLSFPVPSGFTGANWRGDVIAGLTVTAIAVPESLGYANVVGLPVQTGLYCALLPAVLFALVASSRHLVVGADSATAALVGVGAATVASPGDPLYPQVIALLGLCTGLFLLIMGVARLGFLADLISQPVLAGFLSGVGVSLMISKTPGMLGLEAHGNSYQIVHDTVRQLDEVNVLAAVLAVGTVATMLLVERRFHRLPAALVAMVVFAVLAALLRAEKHGVAMIGDVPAGLPDLSLPTPQGLPDHGLAAIAATSMALAVVILVQSAAVGRSFAGEYGYRDDTDRDLFALAAANAGSALTGGFAINGSPPRTKASADAGGRSQLVCLVMAAVTACLLLFATGLLAALPYPVLDAVVFAIGYGLIKTRQLGEIKRQRFSEFVTALLALLVVAFVGVQQGIVLAVLISLVDRLRRQYRPTDDVLVHDGTVAARLRDRLHVVAPDDGSTPLAGVLVYRFGTGLFFENSGFFEERIQALVGQARLPVRAIVIDAAAMDDIDYSGTEVLRRLARQYARRQVSVFVTELAPSARDSVRRAELDEVLVVVPRLEDAIRQASLLDLDLDH